MVPRDGCPRCSGTGVTRWRKGRMPAEAESQCGEPWRRPHRNRYAALVTVWMRLRLQAARKEERHFGTLSRSRAHRPREHASVAAARHLAAVFNQQSQRAQALWWQVNSFPRRHKRAITLEAKAAKGNCGLLGPAAGNAAGGSGAVKSGKADASLFHSNQRHFAVSLQPVGLPGPLCSCKRLSLLWSPDPLQGQQGKAGPGPAKVAAFWSGILVSSDYLFSRSWEGLIHTFTV